MVSEEKSFPFERFAKEIFGLSRPEEGVEALKKWFIKIGSPVSFREVGFDEKAVEEIAQMTVKIAHIWGLEKIYDYETAKNILKMAL